MNTNPFVIFKRVEIDLTKELSRIANAKYNAHQREALTKLIDLFEQGKWQECLDHINDEAAFPYNDEGGYSEVEHIGVEIGDILHDMAHNNYYTKEDLLAQAHEILKKQGKL